MLQVTKECPVDIGSELSHRPCKQANSLRLPDPLVEGTDL